MNWITIILIIGLTVNQISGRKSDNDKSSSSEKTSSEDSKVKKPYQFGYEIEDGQGNMQHRHEHSDGSGAKVGSYGYVDANGIYRKVEYIADDKGFRVKMSSNEPGMKDINTPSISMVTKPYSTNDLEAPSTPSPPVVPRPVPAGDEEGMYNSLERESSRLSPSKSSDTEYRSKPKLHLEPKHHDYLYNPRISPSSSKEIVQQRPSSLYPHSLTISKPSFLTSHENKPSPSSAESHYSPPLKPLHSSGEANSLSNSGEISFRSNQRPVFSQQSFTPLKSMEDKSKESLSSENNLNSIDLNRHKSLPYSQYDPMKREKEKALNQQLTKSMKAPYELDDHFHPNVYHSNNNQPSHNFPLPTPKEDAPIKDHRFTAPSKWTKHEDDPKRKEIIDKPIYPIASRYHHEPMSKYSGPMHLKNNPYTGYQVKEAPSQLPSPPLSSRPYDYRETTSPLPPRSAGYLATELPLPPPRSNNYDSSHETQLPPPPSSPPPIHSSIYHVDDHSSHETPDSRERPHHFSSSSAPPFEPSRLKSESYSDLLPLPPPSSSHPHSPPPPPPMHQSDFHGPPRKRPAAYPPRPEIPDTHDSESNLPQVIYDSRESESAEHGGGPSSERHYPINNRNSDHPDHDWYSVDGDSRHQSPPSPRQSSYPRGGDKFNGKDESVYINKLPYNSMETQTKPTYPLTNDFVRTNNVPTINARYPRHKSNDENESIEKKDKQLRGTSSEIYSNFKTGLRGLFNQMNRDKNNPYTELKKDEQSINNHLTNQQPPPPPPPSSSSSSSSLTKSSDEIISKPKQLAITKSSPSISSEDTKSNAPVYRD